jgi:hypothetical protein
LNKTITETATKQKQVLSASNSYSSNNSDYSVLYNKFLQSALHFMENLVPNPVDFIARNPDSDLAENLGSGTSREVSC